MHFYNQSKLFEVLISAAGSGDLRPDLALLTEYKKERFALALQALRSRNVFLYTEGTRTSVNLNNVTTCYTQPAGERMILMGYADNMRYGRVTAQGGVERFFLQTHRVRVVGRRERVIVEDFVPSQAGVGGEPRYTNISLTAPIVIEPQEQIAVDMGYDQAAVAVVPPGLPPQAFIFFCLRVKSRLDPMDVDAVGEIERAIQNLDYQRDVILNAATLGQPELFYNPASTPGVKAIAETRPANMPLLVKGIGTSLFASKITITDTADGYSFSLNRPMQSGALNMPDFIDTIAPSLPADGAPAFAPDWTNYFELPVPHLLRGGALLRVEAINGGFDFSGAPVVEPTAPTTSAVCFRCVTV